MAIKNVGKQIPRRPSECELQDREPRALKLWLSHITFGISRSTRIRVRSMWLVRWRSRSRTGHEGLQVTSTVTQFDSETRAQATSTPLRPADANLNCSAQNSASRQARPGPCVGRTGFDSGRRVTPSFPRTDADPFVLAISESAGAVMGRRSDGAPESGPSEAFSLRPVRADVSFDRVKSEIRGAISARKRDPLKTP